MLARETRWEVDRQFLGKTPIGSFALCHDLRPPSFAVVRRLSSTIMKWVARISGERFELESSNFTKTCTPTCCAITSDMTSLAASDWKLSRKKPWWKMPPPTALGGISRERFKRGSPNSTHLSETIGNTKLPDSHMASLAASGRLQSAIKYCTKVDKTGPAGQRVEQFGRCMLNLESPNLAGPSIPT